MAMSNEDLRNVARLMDKMAGALFDVAQIVDEISDCLNIDEVEIVLGDVHNSKQKRVKESLRDDAIDDLLKREGYTW